MSGTMPMPVMRRVGGISMVRPSTVVNWLLREGLMAQVIVVLLSQVDNIPRGHGLGDAVNGVVEGHEAAGGILPYPGRTVIEIPTRPSCVFALF
jgi:hypothetical protein